MYLPLSHFFINQLSICVFILNTAPYSRSWSGVTSFGTTSISSEGGVKTVRPLNDNVNQKRTTSSTN